MRTHRSTARRSLVAATALALGLTSAPLALALLGDSKTLDYPKTRKDDTVDTYHGTKVPDPFRWLEDDNSAETKTWVEAQNKVTFGFLESIPQRQALRDRLTELWDYEKFGAPSKEGDRYFYSRNSGLQNQSVFYTTKSLDEDGKVLMDPNTLSADGTVALSGLSISLDGTKMAYAVSDAGSDWKTWKVRDVETGKDLPDEVRWSKFSGASFTKDGSGFFYGRYPEPKAGDDLKGVNYFQKLYFHKLGTPQTDDVLIYENNDEKEWGFDGTVTDDGKYLIVTVRKGTDDRYMILWKDLTEPKAEVKTLIGTFENDYTFIDNDGPTFWFRTNRDAPRGKVVAINTNHPDPSEWIDVIPEAPETLESADVVGERFFATYLKDAATQIRAFDLGGKPLGEVKLPGLGTASGFSGKRTDTETFYAYTSFTTPTTIYRYDVASGESTVFRKPAVKFDPEQYTTEQVFYTSKDGTKVPMFISYKKGLKRDGSNPTYLYGYGGFNISLTPAFSVTNLVWMEMGGIFAQPNLRGGGEYGKAWHDAGRLANKQNVFDDFIAAAEYLIAEKYTSTPKLAIGGGSNGGLLVGACMTQRPELYGAALPAVGVMDMLRFHKFTIGWAWVDDYGSSDNADQFQTLLAYSPLHNLKPGTCYPPTMVLTADHDDRVVPAHSFKFAAKLQESQSCDNPVLIRIETRAGHGAGKPTAKIIEEAADRWAFLVKVLGMSPTIGVTR